VINVVSGTTALDLWEPGHRPAAVVRVRNIDEWMVPSPPAEESD